MDIERIRTWSKANLESVNRRIEATANKLDDEIVAEFEADCKVRTPEEDEELVRLILTGKCSISVNGDMLKFLDNISKYGGRGLYMSC